MPSPHDVKIPAGTPAALRALLAKYEAVVEGLRVTLGVVNGTAHSAAQARQPAVLGRALELDAVRRGGSPKPRKAKRAKRGSGVPKKLARRSATAQLLGKFGDDPRPATGLGRGVGALLAAGYLKKRAGGYVRTAKPFVVDPRVGAAE